MSKTILVVGGTSGIGLACIKLLSDYGKNIYSVSRASKIEYEYPNVQHFTVDVSDDSVNYDFLPDALDALVYCPGSINLKPFSSLSIEDFRKDYELNLIGYVRVLKATIDKLKKSGNASVIAFSTVAVSQGMSYHSSIASAKGAIEGITRSLAAEYAKANIRFNAIAPSLIDTPLASLFTKSSAKLQTISNRHPLKRIGNPKEVAELVKFLVSDSSTWMTGQIIGLDGGLSAIKTLD